jgi:putative membrane protein
MKAIASSVFCCMVLCGSALAQHKGPANITDQDFITLAAQSDMTEAHLGQMAAEQASSQAVKDYAQTLVTEHTSDYNKLTALAKKANLTVPTGIDDKHQKMIAPLEKLKGKAFDRSYIHTMITSHETAAAAYDLESRSGQNADVKAYAQQTLPTLEKHKNDAKALMKPGK